MNVLAPGVYVEEVKTSPNVIEPVGTSTAGFLGIAPDASALVNEPFRITSWAEFRRAYIDGAPASTRETTHLAQAVYGFFQNGGSACYVVNLGPHGRLQGADAGGLAALERVDEVAIVAAPGYTTQGDYDALLSHCEMLGDRVAVLDAPLDIGGRVERLTRVGMGGLDDSAGDEEDSPESASGMGSGLRPRASERGHGALYFPWFEAVNVVRRGPSLNVPPSGHIAGIYARTDAERGVHKAPANTTLRGAGKLAHIVTRAEQELLNPAGVNCIRKFRMEGTLVWGARTLASDSEWKYVPVRRLFNMVEESIEEQTRWVVFEPNDEALWKKVTASIRWFLRGLWVQGALVGATPEEAFFVKCDAETNPPESVAAGKVVTQIGLAPVKPAEFVVFQIGQHQAGTDTSEAEEESDA